MINKNILLLVAIFFLHNISEAHVKKYSNEFLSIGISARSLAMSGASVASVSDVGGLIGILPALWE